MTKLQFIKLNAAWKARANLIAKGAELKFQVTWNHGNVRDSDSWDDSDTIKPSEEILFAAGSALIAEGDRLWAEKVLAVCGDVTMQWKHVGSGYDCILNIDDDNVIQFRLIK